MATPEGTDRFERVGNDAHAEKSLGKQVLLMKAWDAHDKRKMQPCSGLKRKVFRKSSLVVALWGAKMSLAAKSSLNRIKRRQFFGVFAYPSESYFASCIDDKGATLSNTLETDEVWVKHAIS